MSPLLVIVHRSLRRSLFLGLVFSGLVAATTQPQGIPRPCSHMAKRKANVFCIMSCPDADLTGSTMPATVAMDNPVPPR